MGALAGVILAAINAGIADIPALYNDYNTIKASFSPETQTQLDTAFANSGVQLDADVAKLDADVAARDAAGS